MEKCSKKILKGEKLCGTTSSGNTLAYSLVVIKNSHQICRQISQPRSLVARSPYQAAPGKNPFQIKSRTDPSILWDRGGKEMVIWIKNPWNSLLKNVPISTIKKIKRCDANENERKYKSNQNRVGTVFGYVSHSATVSISPTGISESWNRTNNFFFSKVELILYWSWLPLTCTVGYLV